MSCYELEYIRPREPLVSITPKQHVNPNTIEKQTRFALPIFNKVPASNDGGSVAALDRTDPYGMGKPLGSGRTFIIMPCGRIPWDALYHELVRHITYPQTNTLYCTPRTKADSSQQYSLPAHPMTKKIMSRIPHMASTAAIARSLTTIDIGCAVTIPVIDLYGGGSWAQSDVPVFEQNMRVLQFPVALWR